VAAASRKSRGRLSDSGLAWGRALFTLFLTAWAFVLGVLVGQGVLATPEQIHWLKHASGLDVVFDSPAAKPPRDDLTKVQLSFYDSLSGDKPGPGGHAPAPAATPAPKKVAAQADDQAGGDYSVQVASFKDKPQAQELAARLSGGGHPSFIVEAQVSGLGPRYRVRVGPFKTKQDAQTAADSIRERHKLAGLVLKEP